RQNLTMRMGMRRFTRLTNGFSKKAENLAAAVSLHFMHYNFARTHKSLANPYPRTPAMAAGVTDHVWSIEEVVSLLG
ncbi:MAG: IS1 family transposase, partial [Candidatus Dormiibacterota bacterium]